MEKHSYSEPSTSRSLALDDGDSDDDVPLARLVQKHEDQMTEEELPELLDAPMWAKINLNDPGASFKEEEEPLVCHQRDD